MHTIDWSDEENRPYVYMCAGVDGVADVKWCEIVYSHLEIKRRAPIFFFRSFIHYMRGGNVREMWDRKIMLEWVRWDRVREHTQQPRVNLQRKSNFLGCHSNFRNAKPNSTGIISMGGGIIVVVFPHFPTFPSFFCRSPTTFSRSPPDLTFNIIQNTHSQTYTSTHAIWEKLLPNFIFDFVHKSFQWNIKHAQIWLEPHEIQIHIKHIIMNCVCVFVYWENVCWTKECAT